MCTNTVNNFVPFLVERELWAVIHYGSQNISCTWAFFQAESARSFWLRISRNFDEDSLHRPSPTDLTDEVAPCAPYQSPSTLRAGLLPSGTAIKQCLKQHNIYPLIHVRTWANCGSFSESYKQREITMSFDLTKACYAIQMQPVCFTGAKCCEWLPCSTSWPADQDVLSRGNIFDNINVTAIMSILLSTNGLFCSCIISIMFYHNHMGHNI